MRMAWKRMEGKYQFASQFAVLFVVHEFDVLFSVLGCVNESCEQIAPLFAVLFVVQSSTSCSASWVASTLKYMNIN